MTYILLVVTAIYSASPHNFTLTEFQNKESCEIALEVAKSFYKTINDESKCISVEKELKKKQKEAELNKLKEELE